MLLEFAISNFRSYKNPSVLSLTTNNTESQKKGFSSKTGNSFAPQASHLTALFGANGSGKSGAIDALNLMQYLVLFSATRKTQGDKLPYYPYKLNTKLSLIHI